MKRSHKALKMHSFEACLTTALDRKGLLIYHVAETGKNCAWNDRGKFLIITAHIITS